MRFHSQLPAYCDYLTYSSGQAGLADFSEWLAKHLVTENFITLSNKFIELNKRLKTELDIETRGYLLKQRGQLQEEV